MKAWWSALDPVETLLVGVVGVLCCAAGVTLLAGVAVAWLVFPVVVCGVGALLALALLWPVVRAWKALSLVAALAEMALADGSSAVPSAVLAQVVDSVMPARDVVARRDRWAAARRGGGPSA